MQAFANCDSLESVSIPDSVTEIGGYAFSECTSLKSINVPDSVTRIGREAFSGCTSLKSINLPNSVTEMGGEAFNSCSGLESVNIPNGVTEIGWRAFYYCKSLKSINVPDSVTKIGREAFRHCESLNSIDIPSGVTEIGEDAFFHCYSLKSINVPDSVTKTSEGTFAECESLNSIDIPNGVTEIGEAAFYYCKSLKSIDIPGSVTKIGKNAFYGCPLDDRTKKRITNVKMNERLGDSSESKLTESLMSRREMIDWIDDNYNTDENYEKLRNAISMIGYDADYIDDSDREEGMYANFSDEELSSIIYILKAREENSSPRQSSKIKSDFTNMSRKEMIDWLEDNWNTSEGYEQLNAAIDAIGYDSDHIDDSDEEEGMYANFSDEDLENIISVLKTGKTKDGHDTSVKPQRIPMTDKKAKDIFKLALNDVGRAIEIDKGTGSALAMYNVMIDGKEYQVQIYRMG